MLTILIHPSNYTAPLLFHLLLQGRFLKGIYLAI